MSERPSVYITLKPYIKAFYISKYGNGPLFFKKKDKINHLLSMLLVKRPPDYKEEIPDRENTLEVSIPFFDHININVYNYLSCRSKKTFERRLRQRFWVAFEDDIEKLILEGFSPGEAIAFFIEKNHLPDDETTESTLRKEIYRVKKLYTILPKRGYKKANF
jgi:hypothetical protein